MMAPWGRPQRPAGWSALLAPSLAVLVAAGGCAITAPTTPPGSPSGVTPTPSAAASAGPTSTVAGPTASAFVPAEPVPLPIEVVDAGLTVFGGEAGGAVSYAAILRNPNTGWALVRAEVLVDFLDPSGAFVGGEELLVTILPGQTTAISGESTGAGEAAQIVVVPPEDETAFLPRPGGEGFDVTDVVTRTVGRQWLTTGVLTSRFTVPQGFVQLFSVHRAPSGAIVGGGGGGVELIEPGASVPFEITDGTPYPQFTTTDVYWQVTR